MRWVFSYQPRTVAALPSERTIESTLADCAATSSPGGPLDPPAPCGCGQASTRGSRRVVSDSMMRTQVLRIVDLCAGLGGFHHGARIAGGIGPGRREPACVLACELDEELRELYVRNFEEDHEFLETYQRFFPPDDCARTPGLEDLYLDGKLVRVHGDLGTLVNRTENRLRRWGKGTRRAGQRIVPDHDLLCAGFPCQPFSKSGYQRGFGDIESGRGTVWQLIWRIIEEIEPPFLLLENVGNFERHDGGNTWDLIRSQLERKYHVVATTHVGSDDSWRGLLSPHHFGLPHHRERFFICGQHKRKIGSFSRPPFPHSFRWEDNAHNRRQRERESALEAARALKQIVLEGQTRASEAELRAAQLATDQLACITHWQALLSKIDGLPASESSRLGPLPSFPIWGFELDPWHHYPFEATDGAPKHAISDTLRRYRRTQIQLASRYQLPSPELGSNASHFGDDTRSTTWREHWPAYACRSEWPRWKILFLRQNREWAWTLIDTFRKTGRLASLKWYRRWLDELYAFPPSFQKLEWNCKGEELDLWKHILQLRPSGLRVKRFQHVPALVALTTTQIPIVPVHRDNTPGPNGARGRFLTPSEAKKLQGLPWDWAVPSSRTRAFCALGNAVHAELIALILRNWFRATQHTASLDRQLNGDRTTARTVPTYTVASVSGQTTRSSPIARQEGRVERILNRVRGT